MNTTPQIFNTVNDQCIAIIRQGGLAIFPTETLYGLGCVATNEAALQRLFAAKERGATQPPPVLISDDKQLWSLIASCNNTAIALMQAHWPGCLTLLLPAREGLSTLLTGVTSDDRMPTVGVRMTAHPVARALCEQVGHPIVATSANISGAMGRAANPHALEDIGESLKSRVDVLIDGGPVRGQPSTIVDCTGEVPRIIRLGALELSEEQLSALV